MFTIKANNLSVNNDGFSLNIGHSEIHTKYLNSSPVRFGQYIFVLYIYVDDMSSYYISVVNMSHDLRQLVLKQ